MFRFGFWESVKQALREYAVAIGMFVVAAIMLAVGSAQISESNSAEALAVVQEGIQRAAVSCYAIEGRYPDTLEYLEENYNVYVDNEKYKVFYEVFASNIMPEITVIER